MSKCQNQNSPQLQKNRVWICQWRNKIQKLSKHYFQIIQKNLCQILHICTNSCSISKLDLKISNIWGGSDGLEKVLRISSQIKFHLGEGLFLVKTWFSDNFSPWWQLQAFVNFSFWSLFWMGPTNLSKFPQIVNCLKVIFFHDNS